MTLRIRIYFGIRYYRLLLCSRNWVDFCVDLTFLVEQYPPKITRIKDFSTKLGTAPTCKFRLAACICWDRSFRPCHKQDLCLHYIYDHRFLLLTEDILSVMCLPPPLANKNSKIKSHLQIFCILWTLIYWYWIVETAAENNEKVGDPM